jgi:hypothetical protein
VGGSCYHESSIGPWGCQVSTGLRDRELQVEVARMAS